MRGLKSFIEVKDDKGKIRLVNLDYVSVISPGANGESTIVFQDDSLMRVRGEYAELRQVLSIRCQVIKLNTGKEVPRE